ncbi:hypothetical protein [Kineococcus sp. SYSU DK006]|uniref:hypothetical protein n=1 Tax=Kineococcus sp. SYSU DK006 TaxID=3383127 RepID=UPI003D7E001B
MSARPLDARLLRTLGHGRRLPWWARAWWPFLTLTAFTALAWVSTPCEPCTPAAPCGAEPVFGVGAGALVAGALLTAAGGWGALAATALGLVLTSAPDDPPLLWAAAAAHLGLQAAVVHRRSATGALRAVRALAARGGGPTGGQVELAVGRVPREEAQVPRTGGQVLRRGVHLLRPGAAVVAAAVLTGALAALAVGVQRHEDAAQRAAAVVDAVVLSHSADGVSVRVRLDGAAVGGAGGARTADVDVLDQADHPVGARTWLWRFPDGGTRPVAEPYDAWGATSATGAALGLLLTAGSRQVVRRTRRCRYLTLPQPTWRARARVLPGVAAVYAVDAAPADEPVLLVPLAGEDDGEFDGEFDGELDGEFEELPDPVDVQLAGLPLPGQWCAVGVDGAWLVPVAAAEPGAGGPPLVLPELDEQGLPLLEVPTGDLAPRDVVPLDGPVGDGGQHRAPAGVAVLALLPALVVSAVGLERVDELLQEVLWRALVAAGLGLLALELAWRGHLRPRLSWDGAGLVVVEEFGRARRSGWDGLVDVEVLPRARLRLVLLTDPAQGLDSPVSVHELTCAHAWLPGWARRGWRTAPQLRAALLAARERGLRGRRPLELVPAPVRPGVLWGVWLLVVVLAWINR